MKKRLVVWLLLISLLFAGCGMDILERYETEPTISMPDLDIIPYVDQRYLVEQLDQKNYTNLCAMYESILNFEDTCDIPYPVDADKIDILLRVLHYDCPELFQVDFTQSVVYHTQNDLVVQMEMPFVIDQEEYEEQYDACMEVIEDLARQAEDMTEAEKEKFVYDYISAQCFYDADTTNAGNAYGCLVEGYAKCDGISLSMKWALEHMGMTCLCIAGDPPDGSIGHAWNVVELDGEFYDVDLTADVRQQDEDTVCMYPAYNVSRQLIRQRYIIDVGLDYFQLPGSDTMDMSYHSLAGNYILENEDPGLKEKFLEAYRTQGSFTLQFEDPGDYKNFMDNLEKDIDKIGKDNSLPGWGWEYQTQEEYCIIRMQVSKP